ncbi:Possible restriction /modification enzyme [Helicobacter heilmannii]|uniref:Eco57I restriction-modification methylase domain-containing protein n=1 Tax=Helicobacter heilmannii TaxID=35817 RepID=UPI0006A00AF2|nr:N-6 DNA methylase [Helicobacter heilmannii]CRF48450.1 Possible restriction /modification enzyme [Helicobacter heilmannii]
MYYLHNTLFTPYTLEQELPKLYHFEQTKEQAREVLEQMRALKLDAIKNSNEHQFEDHFIAKILELLGWEYLRQEEKIIQHKLEKPDFLLFATPKLKQDYQALSKEERYASNEFFSVICESKAYSVEVDNKKIAHNPHYQLLGYLNALRHNYGFLTNGRVWRFYDASKPVMQKAFFEVHLEKILERADIEAFLYFYHLFRAANFAPAQDTPSIHTALSANESTKIALEEDLHRLIYGTDGQESLFETIGAALYARHPQEPLKDIYENTLYFVFKLLFIAYFEDKFEENLKEHRGFAQYLSVRHLLATLQEHPKTYYGMGRLEEIFHTYNQGNENYAMPIFNGGLFEPSKTPLFKAGKILSDALLKQILTQLFTYENCRRGYATLSVVHLGRIYENLLSYRFAIAHQELFYCTTLKSEGYYDGYDKQALEAKEKIKQVQRYTKGQIYLKNTSNSRKSSGSFYTPESITQVLVREALEGLNAQNILSFKILDNACGSGAFLIEALHQASQKALELQNAQLQTLLEQEKALIEAQAQNYLESYRVDELDVLKRLLLKRLIYGVDKNPFSVELAKLSLWIDSFIFGTPLSFLEHHIKCGDALMGCSLAEFEAFCKEGLFNPNFFQEFETLKSLFNDLANTKDSTKEEIAHSKALYTQIKPLLDKLNLYLNFYNTHQILSLEIKEAQEPKNQDQKNKARKKPPNPLLKARLELQEWWDKNGRGLESVGLEQLLTPERAELKEFIEKCAEEFKFFNYEIEFPEISQGGGGLFSLQHSGFDAIITNPPWEKTKFDESEFFSSFRSNYRSYSLAEKQKFKEEALAQPHIKEQFDTEQAQIQTTNAYYKAHYPYSRGAGDGNLFRFFVEKNSSLLAPNARLALVIPSALMLEEGSLSLRKHLLERLRVEFFYSFENRQNIFKNVHRCYKFALLALRKAKPAAKLKALFYLEHPKEINNPLLIPLKSVLNSPKCALKEVRGQMDLEILEHCASKFARLNEGWINFRRELDMTGDKDLFKPQMWLDFRSELHMSADKDLFKPIDARAKTQTKLTLLPLLEGKHIHQFNAEFAHPRYQVNKSELEEKLKSREEHRAQKGGYSGKIAYEYAYWRLGYRGIARDTDERSLIVSLIPKGCSAGNSIYVSIPKFYTPEGILEVPPLQTLFALGLLNSLVVDFYLRLHTQMNINKIYLYELPLPQPTPQEIAQTPLYFSIAKCALECQLYYDRAGHFKELADLFSSGALTPSLSANTLCLDVPKTPKLLDTKRARLDISIARGIYALNCDQFMHLLASFKVLAKKQPGFVGLLKSLWAEQA